MGLETLKLWGIAGPVLRDVGLRDMGDVGDVRDVRDVKDGTWKLGTSGT